MINTEAKIRCSKCAYKIRTVGHYCSWRIYIPCEATKKRVFNLRHCELECKAKIILVSDKLDAQFLL
jgi:hypothetical protein